MEDEWICVMICELGKKANIERERIGMNVRDRSVFV